MATKTGEPYSVKSQKLMDMMDTYSVGVFGGVPSFVVSGKSSTLVVSSRYGLEFRGDSSSLNKQIYLNF